MDLDFFDFIINLISDQIDNLVIYDMKGIFISVILDNNSRVINEASLTTIVLED